MSNRSFQEMTLWFAGEARLRELLESGWVGTMRNDGPIWKVRVVRPVAKTPPDEAPEL
ncbi:MAG: hypothetical protein KJ060_10495 [Candidatus Hydrogenedentes bacterium]|nr:hypothetical protein [Candidatus Hydrogenedentota bacterium]